MLTRSFGSGDITLLFGKMTSCDHMNKGKRDLVSEGPSTSVAIVVSFFACRSCGSGNLTCLFWKTMPRNHRTREGHHVTT